MMIKSGFIVSPKQTCIGNCSKRAAYIFLHISAQLKRVEDITRWCILVTQESNTVLKLKKKHGAPQLNNCDSYLYTGCEINCIVEQNAPHFRHFATQFSACIAVFTM